MSISEKIKYDNLIFHLKNCAIFIIFNISIAMIHEKIFDDIIQDCYNRGVPFYMDESYDIYFDISLIRNSGLMLILYFSNTIKRNIDMYSSIAYCGSIYFFPPVILEADVQTWYMQPLSETYILLLEMLLIIYYKNWYYNNKRYF